MVRKPSAVGAGSNIYKVFDDGVSHADNGKRVDSLGTPDTDWPVPKSAWGGYEVCGSMTSRILYYNNRLYWGTREGYCYAMGFEWEGTPTSGDEALLTGFPYRLPGHKVTDVFILESGVYYVTTGGMMIRGPVQ